MQPDIDRTIASLAQRYTDQSCPQLHFDELMGEGRYKLAQLLDKGELYRQPTRTNFFKFFKAAVANQFRSLVQKHRFTFKRTGCKPPPRHRDLSVPMTEAELEAELHHHKQIEISIDDPEANVQPPDHEHAPAIDDGCLEDYAQLLTPIERHIFNELMEPCPETRAHATLEAYRGRKPGSGIHVDFNYDVHAQGFGLSPELFKEAVLSIRQKIDAYKQMKNDELTARSRRSAIIQQLSEIFAVQVPGTVDDTVIARLFTIAARDQYVKVRDNPQVVELLQDVGAKVPRIHGDLLSCFGVLFQRTDKRCDGCGLRQACAVEAHNVGLGKISLSAKLLGAKNMRIPAILPNFDQTRKQHRANANDIEVVTYLNETFTRLVRRNKVYYIHQPNQDETTRKRRLLFCLESEESPLSLRFCNPSVSLKKRLMGSVKSWYAAPGTEVSALIALIDMHAEEAFVGNESDEEPVDEDGHARA